MPVVSKRLAARMSWLCFAWRGCVWGIGKMRGAFECVRLGARDLKGGACGFKALGGEEWGGCALRVSVV